MRVRPEEGSPLGSAARSILGAVTEQTDRLNKALAGRHRIERRAKLGVGFKW